MTRAIPAGNFKTLSTYFSIGIGPIDSYATRDWKGNPCIPHGQVIMTAAFLYEQMAILGRARCKNLRELAKAIPISAGSEDDFINGSQKRAKERLEKLGKQPDSFYIFILATELQKEGLNFFVIGDIDVYKRNMLKACTRKWSLTKNDVHLLIQAIGTEGIGFGSCFPDLTKQMYENTYSSFDYKEWSEWKRYGLDVPERPPQFPSFQEYEQNILKALATYVSEHNPELLDTLDLHFNEYWTPGKPLFE